MNTKQLFSYVILVIVFIIAFGNVLQIAQNIANSDFDNKTYDEDKYEDEIKPNDEDPEDVNLIFNIIEYRNYVLVLWDDPYSLYRHKMRNYFIFEKVENTFKVVGLKMGWIGSSGLSYYGHLNAIFKIENQTYKLQSTEAKNMIGLAANEYTKAFLQDAYGVAYLNNDFLLLEYQYLFSGVINPQAGEYEPSNDYTFKDNILENTADYYVKINNINNTKLCKILFDIYIGASNQHGDRMDSGDLYNVELDSENFVVRKNSFTDKPINANIFADVIFEKSSISFGGIS